MREIRMLRAKWRGLETEPWITLTGHAGGNPGYRQGRSCRPPRQSSTLPGAAVELVPAHAFCTRVCITGLDEASRMPLNPNHTNGLTD